MPKSTAWRYYRKSDGRWYRKWREPGSRRIYQQLEHRWVWEQANGPIPDGYEVHHRNHDATDNRLDNLQLLSIAEHDEYHQRLREDHRPDADGVITRRCQRCGEYKPLDQFTKRKAGTYHGYCKPCVAAYLREWKQRNREHYLEYRRARRAAGLPA
jgi:hypothetical protein